MAIRVVRLGSPRAPDEGLRIGTVRHPPRSVPKAELAARDFYDVWYPNLAPSAELVKLGRQAATSEATARDWSTFARRYRREMSTPENRRSLALLAALSHHADFSVGCYCEDETRCHRSILKELLVTHGACLK